MEDSVQKEPTGGGTPYLLPIVSQETVAFGNNQGVTCLQPQGAPAHLCKFSNIAIAINLQKETILRRRIEPPIVAGGNVLRAFMSTEANSACRPQAIVRLEWIHQPKIPGSFPGDRIDGNRP